MGKLKNSQSGFTAVEGLLIVLIVVAIGAVGYMVYHNDHKTKTASAITTASNKPATTTKTTTATNPYAGWKTVSTVDNLSLKYPSAWTVKDNSSSNNNKADLTVTSPDNSIFAVQNGVVEPGGLTIATSSPITFNKQSEYLLYGTDGPASGDTFNQFELSSSATSYDPLNTSDGNTAWMVTFYSSSPASASNLSSNSDFQTAKLIAQSVAY